MTDKFFEGFGKFVCVLSFCFLLLCALIGAMLLIQGEQDSRTQPVFTIAPDTAKRAK